MAVKQIDYKTAWSDTMADLRETFSKWNVPTRDWNVECQAARFGGYRTLNLAPAERAVTLRFPYQGREVVLTVDAQAHAAGNLRVLYLAVESLRLNEVRGLDSVIRDAYLQLEAPAVTRDPYEVLGIRPDAPLGVAEAAYKALARTLHPDAGGTTEAFQELVEALERVRSDRSGVEP